MRRPLLALVLLAVASSAEGQINDRRVELEEFAVPEETQVDDVRGQAIGQITDVQADRVGKDLRTADRNVILPQDRRAHDVGVAQVPRSADDVASLQISGSDGGRSVDPGDLSSPDQSAPGDVTRLSGRDRCDPQADQSLYRACLRILERRSAEFKAPSAPALSAEEALLAQRRADDEDPATLTLEQRIRRASQNTPDAELSSNQEIASLILPNTFGSPGEPLQQETSLRAEEVDAVLKAIGITVPPQP